jgi:ribonuclease PH
VWTVREIIYINEKGKLQIQGIVMRSNARKTDEMREVRVSPGFMEFAEGSCLFEMGNTKVICTASVEDGVPLFLRGKGQGWITSEYGLIPRSCKQRVTREASKGKKTGRTHEVQRLIGRSLRGAVDMKKLGEKTIWIDCDVIQADGGTRCASITGSFIALYMALGWMRDKGMIKELAVEHFVAAVSVGIHDGNALLDLDYAEDSTAEVDMNIVMTDSGSFVEIQGTAEGRPFNAEQMSSLIKLGQKGIFDLIQKQKAVLKGVI